MTNIDLRIAGFLYHDVIVDAQPSGFQRPAALPYKHDWQEFRDNLDQISDSFAEPTLITAINFAVPGKHIALTFDDGGKSCLHISDELLKRGWRGHFFITTNRIGERTFLSKEEIRHIHNAGHLIGSHSHTHPDIFHDQTVPKMVTEWRVSKDILAQLLGTACVSASIPGGDFSPSVAFSANESGLHYLFTSEPWLKPNKIEDCWLLGRVCPKVGTDLNTIADLAQFKGWRRALLMRKTKTTVKSLLFPLYKHYVRKTTTESRKTA